MASCVKSLRNLSFSHVAIAILAIITGIASMNVTDYYTGVFGMGIWLGGWVCVEYKFLYHLLSKRNVLTNGNSCVVKIFSFNSDSSFPKFFVTSVGIACKFPVVFALRSDLQILNFASL